MSLLNRLRRELTFARHVPLRRILRRFQLIVRRRWSDVSPPHYAAPPPLRSIEPPAPLLPPRSGMIIRDCDVLKFCFLNNAESICSPIIWDTRRSNSSTLLWRMHLHYMEFLEEASSNETASWILQWIIANPSNKRGFWRDSWLPYTISLRIVVWMQQLARCRDQLSAEAERSVAASLAEQIRYLVDNLETDVGGNHLIKNAKALLWASAYFTGREAASWARRGESILRRELASQILADGFHFERSSSYHAQVFVDLLEVRSLPISLALAADLDYRLDKMAQVIADLSHPDGLVALFNDSGLNMSYQPAVCLAAYRQLTGKQPTPARLFSYPISGYHGARFADDYCVVDCGAIGPNELPAHSHGDVLSFELSLGGQRFIVDQGVFEYNSGQRRQSSRSCANHNTLSLIDTDQADFFSSFRVGRRPEVNLKSYYIHADSFTLSGEHDGFSHICGSPVHQRNFSFQPGRIEISDQVRGSSSRDGRISFLLHPDIMVEPISPYSWRLRGDEVEAIIRSEEAIEIEAAFWWPDLGKELPTQRLVIALQADRLREPVASDITWNKRE